MFCLYTHSVKYCNLDDFMQGGEYVDEVGRVFRWMGCGYPKDDEGNVLRYSKRLSLTNKTRELLLEKEHVVYIKITPSGIRPNHQFAGRAVSVLEEHVTAITDLARIPHLAVGSVLYELEGSVKRFRFGCNEYSLIRSIDYVEVFVVCRS